MGPYQTNASILPGVGGVHKPCKWFRVFGLGLGVYGLGV